MKKSKNIKKIIQNEEHQEKSQKIKKIIQIEHQDNQRK